MTELRGYVLSAVAAACFCGIVLSILPKGSTRELLKLLCGLFLAFTALSPLTRLDLSFAEEFVNRFAGEAAQTAALGEQYSQKQIRDSIKTETEAYILDKANAIGAAITPEVTLSADPVPIPIGVRICGAISPYARQRLETMLQEELGISKENQLWIG